MSLVMLGAPLDFKQKYYIAVFSTDQGVKRTYYLALYVKL